MKSMHTMKSLLIGLITVTASMAFADSEIYTLPLNQTLQATVRGCRDQVKDIEFPVLDNLQFQSSILNEQKFFVRQEAPAPLKNAQLMITSRISSNKKGEPTTEISTVACGYTATAGSYCSTVRNSVSVADLNEKGTITFDQDCASERNDEWIEGNSTDTKAPALFSIKIVVIKNK